MVDVLIHTCRLWLLPTANLNCRLCVEYYMILIKNMHCKLRHGLHFTCIIVVSIHVLIFALTYRCRYWVEIDTMNSCMGNLLEKLDHFIFFRL